MVQLLTYQTIPESWYSNIRSPSDSISPASSTESGSLPDKRSTGRPDAEGQCQQFFDLLRNQCNAQSGQKHGKPDDSQCLQEKPEKPDTFVEESTRVTCRSAGNQNGGKVATRMVPKMGTKVEFTRPVTSPLSGRVPNHPPWQLPLKLETRCVQPPVTQNRLGDFRGRNPDHNSNPLDPRSTRNPDHNSNPRDPRSMRNPDHNSNPFDPKSVQSNSENSFVLLHPGGFYHSDSERSNLASKYSPRNLREWNSDGDSKNFSFPSSDDSTDQSPEPHDAPSEGPQKMDSLRRLYEQYADVMYTNEANLQHTIMVQQRLFEQQIANRNRPDERKLCMKSTQPIRSIPHGPWAAHTPEQSAPLEWVIKRRADGTRYITRRPIVTKGRERVKQQPVDDKRCVVMTTDDDAGSERKAGRYWTKEERRQHVEKARDQKRIKESVVKPPLGVAQETSLPNSVQPGETKKTKVRKEQIRVRSQDHAVTYQELLAHGRVEAQGKPSENPLLSVITI